ncbi:TonB-dependent receptor [Dysgonomonas massiliensis]|uniref:TonB-dependent receptor n=1 Tax=Dysgonomonas massiliensis TaxID=2040292 RepID=UPI000C774F11|nr:TonB-dependent receptor [Dysgonomonas massiliensis]
MIQKLLILLFVLASSTSAFCQKSHLRGHVTDTETGEGFPYTTIVVKGTNIATSTDSDGNYSLNNLPKGLTTLIAHISGYNKEEQSIELNEGENILNFTIKPSKVALDEIVVTANRNATKRKEASVIVGILDEKLFETTSSCNLAEGLNFQTGLRVENNCQNCGFQQVRINGLEGPYSQILIDSKAIFSSLAGVYGIEHIPSNMIDRVEIVRGGGSALFGSNAIGGTINIITKEPLSNGFSVSETISLIDGNSPDNAVNINGSLITKDRKAGIYLFSMFRNRKAWDADDDEFSELGKLDSNSGGFRSFYKPTHFSKLTLEYHRIKEDRRGGDHLHLQPHQTQITEMANHSIHGGGINYQLYSPDYKHSFNIYTSLQDVKRDTYYGADYDEDAYGNTSDITVASGAQYAYSFDKLWFMPSQLTAGFEYHYDNLHDEMIGYKRDIKQITRIYGGYFQNEWKDERWTLLLGARLDKHNLIDNAIFSPRVNIRYTPIKPLIFRASYAAGYRAPQTFDEDLHVTAVGGAVTLISNSKDLKPEYSHSISGSLDYTFEIGSCDFNIVIDGFYTKLDDVFYLAKINKDAQGNTLKERRNGSGATIKGINLEMQARPTNWIELQGGFTFQQSKYKKAIAWNVDIEEDGIESALFTKKLTRTPDYYGFLAANINPTKQFMISLSGNYTGSMYVPHLAGYIEDDILKHTKDFFDLGIRLAYDFKLTKELTIQVNGGVKNAFNSFQKDFDKGMLRDAGYMYGPGLPRTFYLGIKMGIF